MRLNLLITLALFFALTAGGAVFAEEIIFFTNGTTMPIRSHVVKSGMVEVDLGSNGMIAFPEEMVEKIERAGHGVYLNPSFQRANVTMPGARGGADLPPPPSSGSFPVSGAGSVPARHRSEKPELTQQKNMIPYGALPTRPGDYGLETAYPLAGHPNKSAREIGVVGRTAASVPGDGKNGRLLGARRVGDKWVVGSSRNPASRGTNTPVTRVELRGQPAPTPEVPESPPAGDSGSAGGDGN